MKQLSALLLTLILFASMLAACSGTQQPVSTGDSQNTAGETTQNIQPSQTQAPEVTLSDTVVYDSDGIKITATGISEGFMGTDIHFLVENNTDRNIAFSADLFIVNGITVSGYAYIDVAAGKKTNDTLTIYSADLEAAGIDTLAIVESKDARIVDTDSYNTIASIPFVLNTSVAQTYVQPIHDAGDLLFDQAGVSMVAQVYSDEIYGSSVRLFARNGAEKDVIVQAENISINGFTVDAWLYDTVYEGTVRYCELDLFSSGLEENGIETVETVTFTIRLIDANTFETIAQSEELQVFVNT